MKIDQPKPEYLKPAPPHANLVKIPRVETSGHPASPYKYNNDVHAALHSILAGLMCREKKDVRYWLETAQGQLDDAVNAIKKPRAKVPPSSQKRQTPLRSTSSGTAPKQNKTIKNRTPQIEGKGAKVKGGSRSPKPLVGHSYVFMRDNHDWHSSEVSVLASRAKRFAVARCCDVADRLLAPQGSPKRKLKTWICTEEELC